MRPESRGSCIIYIRPIKLWVGGCGETGVEEKQEEAERGFKHLNKKLFDLRCWSRRRTELNKDVENFSEREKSRDDEFNPNETRTHDTTKPTREINNIHTQVLENDKDRETQGFLQRDTERELVVDEGGAIRRLLLASHFKSKWRMLWCHWDLQEGLH